MDSSVGCFSGWVPKSINLGSPNKGELSADQISEMKALPVKSEISTWISHILGESAKRNIFFSVLSDT